MPEIKIPMNDVIKYRRQIHENPELSFQEFETAKYIYDNLKNIEGLQVEMPLKNAVVATLKGKKTGVDKTVALRADIDALPVEELAEVDFKSKKKGVMHACGHDVHTAILMGSVEVLSKMTNKFSGTVKFIFQPAEEIPPGGAAELVKLGVMEGVDYIFGLHVFPGRPTGSLGTMKGYSSASQDIFELLIKGKGSHGSTPELSIDPITIGSQVITNLNSVISRNVGALKNAVLSYGQFTSGEVFNVIPHYATIKGTVRTTDSETRKLMEKRIREIIEHVCMAYEAEYDLNYMTGYSSIYNDPEAVEIALAAFNKVVDGNQNMIVPLKIMMGSEDFSEYTNVSKGAFIALGGGLAKDGYGYMNHHPMFKIDEQAMENGVKVEVQLVLDILG